MEVLFKKSDAMTDWYVIERRHHDGRSWLKPIGGNGMQFMTSSRLSPEADVEGTSGEMLAIAAAIRSGGSQRFKRVAVRWLPSCVEVWSPKNSLQATELTHAEALDLASQIEAMFPQAAAETVTNPPEDSTVDTAVMATVVTALIDAGSSTPRVADVPDDPPLVSGDGGDFGGGGADGGWSGD